MMQEQQKVVFSATFAEEMKNMRDAQFTGLPESEAMGRVRSVLDSKGVYMSAESVQEIVRAAQAEREPYTHCGIHAARAAQPKQPKQANGGEAVAGELDPLRAYEFGQLITKYSESFNGQNWDSVCDSVDRKNLAVALDHLTEAGSMLMNISERLLRTHPDTAASVSDAWFSTLAKVTNTLECMCGHCVETAPLADLRVAAEWIKEARAILAMRPQAKGGADGDHVERLRSLVKSVAESEIPEMEDYSEAARRFFAAEPTKESGA